MIVLVGESASGKSTIERHLCIYHGFRRTISYTTRPPRPSEEDGVDYHFISRDDFLNKQRAGFFAEVGKYNGWYYGTAREDCTDDKVAVLTPHGLRQMRAIPGINVVSFYIKTLRKDRLIRALNRDITVDIEEIKRRDGSDVGQFDGIEDEVDHVIHNTADGVATSQAMKIATLYNKGLADMHVKSRLTILCDIDNVINNLTERVIEEYNKKYGDNVKFEELAKYDISGYVKCVDVWSEFCDNDLLSSLVVPQYAKGVIYDLSKNHDFYFITTTHPAHVEVKNKWLEEQFPLSYNRKMLIVCNDKSLVHGDILIDDFADNCHSNVKWNLLVDKPWNREFEGNNLINVKRVCDWYDIYEFINKWKG